MTLPKLSSLTPEQIRVMIAEACGWRWSLNHAGYRYMANGGGYGLAQGDEPMCEDAMRDIPDYLSDLNAMHEAEKVLTDEQWEFYADHLLWRTGADSHSSYTACRVGCSAKPILRAHAFLLATGKAQP